MIESAAPIESQRKDNPWVPGFPISQSSTTESKNSRSESFGRKCVVSDDHWRNDIFMHVRPVHCVQVECVVSAPVLSWAFQLEAVTASSSQEQIVNETLEQIYALERMQQGRFAARKLMIFVETNFKKKNLTLTSSLLDKVKLNFLGMHALLGLTRSTLRARAGLPAWDAIYRKSRVAVEDRGFNADELFVGMPRVESAIKDDGNRANH